MLVAEDNAVNQRLIRRMLEKEGHTVTLASDGIEAVTLSSLNTYDIILMDIQMPLLDGVGATAFIREKQPQHSKVPILAMTAHAMVGDREKYINLGLDDYISKPFSTKEMLFLELKQNNG